MQSSSLLIFDVGDHACALPVEDLVEVLPMVSVSRPVSSPSFLAGFLNVGGTAIPVLHISRLLDIPDVIPTPQASIVVVRHDGQRWGLIASDIRQIITASSSAVTPLPQNAVATKSINLDGKVIPILNVESLLLEQERRRVMELQTAHQRRLHELEEVSSC